MPILGNDTKPGFSYHAYGGSGYPNQEAEDVDLPAQRIRILRLGVWVGGWNDAPRVCLTLWDSSTGELLAQSQQFTVANMGAEGGGRVQRYEADLITPYDTPAAGGTVRVGFTRDRSDAHQVSTGTTVNGHFHGRAGYPAGKFAEIDGGFAENRRIGCWIQDYKALANAKVLRSGSWQDAQAVSVFRAGSWQQAEAVKILRSGSWVDAD